MSTAIDSVSSNSPVWESDFDPLALASVLRPFDGRSTIAPATVPEAILSYSSFRPKLLPPNQVHFMIPLLEIQREMEQLSKEEAFVADVDIRNHLDYLKALNTQRIEELHKLSKELTSHTTWSKFMTVAEYIGSFSSLSSGLALIATCPIIGTAFLAAGVIGLTNRLMTDMGGYRALDACYHAASEEHQIELEKDCDLKFGWTWTILSIGAATSAMYERYNGVLNTGAFTVARDLKGLWKHASVIASWQGPLTIISSSVQGVARLGSMLNDHAIIQLKASVKNLDNEALVARDETDYAAKELASCLKISNQISEVIKQAISI